MGDAVHAAARRAAGIDDHQRGAGGQPLEAARQRHRRRRLARARARQHEVHQGALAFPAAVEQREAAVAVAEEAQHRRHAVDRGDQLGRRAALGRAQRGAHVEQVAQHRDLQVRRALGHDAVVRRRSASRTWRAAPRFCSRLFSKRLPSRRKARSAKIIAFSAGTASWPISPVRAMRRRWARWRPSASDEARRESRIGRGGQPVVMADPVDHARGQHLALPASPATSAIRARSSRRPGCTASAAAEASPQSRRSRSQAKPFRASSHSVLVPSRRHGGSSLCGATAPTWPWAISSPTTSRRPTTASPGHGSGATAKKLRGLRWPRVRE